MALKIRLRRVGATKQPSYRVVIAEARFPRDGRFVETVGQYHPLSHPAVFKINEERVQYWQSQGAQPTATVSRLMKSMATNAEPASATSIEATGSESPVA